MPGTEPAGKRLAVHARQLALEPNLQILRRHRRPLSRCLEQAHRSALADHVHRTAPMGLCVMISESWYKSLLQSIYHHIFRKMALPRIQFAALLTLVSERDCLISSSQELHLI